MAHVLPRQIRNLIAEFSKLPGIGPKSAERLTFYLLKQPDQELTAFGQSIAQAKKDLFSCRQCHTIADKELCETCADTTRDQARICVVEEALDMVALEKSKEFHGLYHVLGGVISPLDGIGPQDLTIDHLLERAHASNPRLQEIILATNPSLEGEATAMYILRKAKGLGIPMTRIARGIPVGGELEYADEITLARALEDRMELKTSS